MNNKWLKRSSTLLLASTIFVSNIDIFSPTTTAQAEEMTSIVDFQTTLKNRTTKADHLTFDIWAKDTYTGEKLNTKYVSVTNNAKKVAVNWDDSEKTSYTLDLAEGANNIEITIAYQNSTVTKNYIITKEAANNGEIIGDFVFSMDAFTLGLGYLIEPERVTIEKGKNSAQTLDSVLTEHNFNYDYTGSLENNFYLSSISKTDQIFNSADVNVPDVLQDAFGSIDQSDFTSENQLGEFDFTYASGWMYAVNNIFPNVGFADHYVQQGDVMRTQFTVAYGSDIGGGWGYNYFDSYSKDEATRTLAYINSSDEKEAILENHDVAQSYDQLMEEVTVVNPEQSVLDNATSQLDINVIKWAREDDNRENAYEEDFTENQLAIVQQIASYEKQIDQLPEASDISLKDAEQVQKLQQKIRTLPTTQQKLIKNSNKLDAILEKIDTLQ